MGEHNPVADEATVAHEILIAHVRPVDDVFTVPSFHEFRSRDRRDNPSGHMRPAITASRVVQLEEPPDAEYSKNDCSHTTIDKCLKRFHGSPCAPPENGAMILKSETYHFHRLHPTRQAGFIGTLSHADGV